MKYVKKDLYILRIEYFILSQQTDISEAGTDLKDMEEGLENIEVRLKTLLHKLTVRDF